LYTACGQCLAFCEHEKGHNNCHRNACNFLPTWFIRKRNQ
jgi:hypothetical protein